MSPKIQSLVTKFVDDLTLAIQDEGAAAFRAAIGSGFAPTNGRRTTPKKTGIMLPPRPRGQKRDPKVLAGLVTSTLAYVKKNPGQRLEQIGSGMGVETAELKLPVQKLLADRSLTKKGIKRATVYRAR